jgi:sugar lactone lactonase YvrE
MSPTPVRATPVAYELAEGPYWDATRERLLWVDIPAGAVQTGALVEGSIEPISELVVDEMVGAVVPTVDGSLLIAGRERLLLVTSDGTVLDGPRVVPEHEARRHNDGSADPAGRFVVGTLSLGEPTGHETLVRLEVDGTVTVLDDDLWLSNGLAWSADRSRMFSVDSLRRTVFVRTYHPSSGRTGPRHVHLELDDDDGIPDGIAVDTADHLWMAVWGAGQVRRYSPDGDVVDIIAVPSPNTSSVAFAGEDLRTLVITTAREGLDGDQLRRFPDAGHLFTARVPVAGAVVEAANVSTRSPVFTAR